MDEVFLLTVRAFWLTVELCRLQSVAVLIRHTFSHCKQRATELKNRAVTLERGSMEEAQDKRRPKTLSGSGVVCEISFHPFFVIPP